MVALIEEEVFICDGVYIDVFGNLQSSCGGEYVSPTFEQWISVMWPFVLVVSVLVLTVVVFVLFGLRKYRAHQRHRDSPLSADFK